MLHSRAAVQDENASAYSTRKGAADAENPVPTAKQSSKGPRKALGNITNVTSRAGQLPPGKTPASGMRQLKGRPLSNITDLRPPLQPKAQKDTVRPSASGPKVKPKSQLDLRAEQYASSGIEQLAGKGWEQLQAEAAQRRDEKIAARVAAFTSAPYQTAVPLLTQDWAAKARSAAMRPVQMPPSPVLSPRDDIGEWKGISCGTMASQGSAHQGEWAELSARTVAEQLPFIRTDEAWGIDPAVLHEAESDSASDDEDNVSCHTEQEESAAELPWLADLDAACDNL